MLEFIFGSALIIGGGYLYRYKVIDVVAVIIAALITFPARFRRQTAYALTKTCENKILGAIAIAENAKHPLEGKNITAQCAAYYATHKFPCVDDLSAWLTPRPRGVTIIHERHGNLIVSIIDLADASNLILDKSEYIFEPLAFRSVDIDDLSGISIYNCRSLSNALIKTDANIEITNND